MRVHLLQISSQERQFIHERRRADRRRVHEFEMRTTAMLDEQRRGINNEATELRMQENEAASTLQTLELELQQQFWNCRVGSTTTKIHVAASYVFLQHYEIKNKFIKQHSPIRNEKYGFKKCMLV